MFYKAPTKINYKGTIYNVDSSVLNIMKIQDIFINSNLSDTKKGVILVKRIFGREAPFTQSLVDLAFEIIMMGNDEVENKRSESGICLFEDFEVYRMEILRSFNVDIKTTKASWEFVINAISNLPKDCKLYEMAYYRTVDLSKIKDKDERKRAKALKEEYKFKREIEKEQDLTDRRNEVMDRWGLNRKE